jgi:RimJ/RimL family protein N-acetyltransferase
MTNVLETPRLLFREYEVTDAEAAFEIYGDPVVMEFIGPNRVTASVAEQREKLIAIRAKYASWGEAYGAFALIERATGELVGTGLLKPLPDANEASTEDIEIGWHLARRCWGRGFATEAGRALAVHGFARLAIDTLNIVIHPGNERSVAVARRLGAVFKGRTTRYYGQDLELFHLERHWTNNYDRRAHQGDGSDFLRDHLQIARGEDFSGRHRAAPGKMVAGPRAAGTADTPWSCFIA